MSTVNAEIWKDISGYEGLYQVSNLGRVKGLARIIPVGNQMRNIPEKLKKLNMPHDSYCTVNLCNFEHVERQESVHRLVAAAFVPNDDVTKTQVNHIDGNKHNNRADNLEWVTPRENTVHAHVTGLASTRGKFNPSAKLPEEVALDIKNMKRNGYSLKHVYQKYIQYNYCTIYDCFHNNTWKYLESDIASKIPVYEIFMSIQGEGPNAGMRCIFVRVAGCPFRCSFCDSKYAWETNNSEIIKYHPKELSEKLIDICKRQNCIHVVLTGGDPCLYDFKEVIYMLNRAEVLVDVETEGWLYPEWLSYVNTVVFSPKPPSSGQPDVYEKLINYLNMLFDENGSYVHTNYVVKIPVFNDADIDFARKYSKFVNQIDNTHLSMYLSVGNSDVTTTESIRDRVLDDYEKLLNKINENPAEFSDVYILPQLHTLIWGNRQGV